MNPSSNEVLNAMQRGGLSRVLRGEDCVFRTPAEINADMLPTDHSQLLEHGLYPLASTLGAENLCAQLERALSDVCHDALGVFCAHQCFYIELINERDADSPLAIDRIDLPKMLAVALVRESDGLRALAFRPSEVAVQRSYKVCISGMRILSRDYGIDWGMTIPPV